MNKIYVNIINHSFLAVLDFTGGNGILGKVGSQSAVACFIVAYARGQSLKKV